MDELSAATPLIARVYPNGSSDVNHFHAAGGMGFVIRELLGAGMLHRDIMTVGGDDLTAYGREPVLEGETLKWRDAPAVSADPTILSTPATPFQPDGGMRLVQGNLGRGTFKTSAVDKERWTVEAPCRIFDNQDDVLTAFKAGELDRDVIVVVRFQGPRANGMPELHKLTPALSVLQDKGFKVALVTDGRMSGASGKVPAAIHVTPEALGGGPLSRLQDGDVIRLCGHEGMLTALGDLTARIPAEAPLYENGLGRELFAMMRAGADEAEKGASAMLAGAGL
jgi:phosphogluconate dehydratase